jgi:predicted PurR-regulated permease PerM
MYLTLRIGGGTLAVLALFVVTYFFGPIVPVMAALALMAVATCRMATRVERKSYFPALAVFAAVALFAPFAHADTTIAVGDLWNGLLPYIVAAIGALITFLVGWVLTLLKTKLGVSIDDSMRASLQTAATNAAGRVFNWLGNTLQDKKVDVGNQFVADAVNHVIKAAA